MDDLKMLLIAIGTHALCAYIGWIRGTKTRKQIDKEQERSNAEDTARQMQSTYQNGIRVGRRMMLDELAHAHLISEDVADALSDGGRR